MTNTDMFAADPSNAEQLRAWDGDEGAYWAANAQYYDRAVAACHDRFMAAAEITATDHVLDIGCGTGQTTREAARAAASGMALGLDLSSQMIAYARARAASDDIGNVTFEQADAQIYPYPAAAFDVAISRSGAMFFGAPVAAFANIRRALRPTGRLVLLAWQLPLANEWMTELTRALAAGREIPAPGPDSVGPFSLASPDRVRGILGSAGFSGISIEGVDAKMWFGSDPDDAFRFVHGMLGWMLDGVDEDNRNRALEALRATVAAHQHPEGVLYDSASWIIRAGLQP